MRCRSVARFVSVRRMRFSIGPKRTSADTTGLRSHTPLVDLTRVKRNIGGFDDADTLWPLAIQYQADDRRQAAGTLLYIISVHVSRADEKAAGVDLHAKTPQVPLWKLNAFLPAD